MTFILISSSLHYTSVLANDATTTTTTSINHVTPGASANKQKEIRIKMKNQIKEQYMKNKQNKTNVKNPHDFHRDRHEMHDTILNRYLNSNEVLGSESNNNDNIHDTYHDEQHIQNIHANVHEHHTIAKKKIEESEKQMDVWREDQIGCLVGNEKLVENVGIKERWALQFVVNRIMVVLLPLIVIHMLMYFLCMVHLLH